MSVEVKIKDTNDAAKKIKDIFIKLKKLNKNFEKTDNDKNMQQKIEIQEDKQEQLLGGTIRGLITFLQSEYPDEINDILKKEKYITNSKSSLTAFEKKLIKSDPGEILEIFLDIFNLDENSPVKFKNNDKGKELNKIVSSFKKLNLNDLLDLILDDDKDKKKNKKKSKESKENDPTSSKIRDAIDKIIKNKKLSHEKKSAGLKKIIIIAKKSFGSKSKKIFPLLDSIDKKLDSISEDSAITKIAGVLEKLLDKIG